MRFSKVIFDFDHTVVDFGPHVDWRAAVRHIESIYLEEGIPQAIVQESKGRGFQLMRQVYDHMLEHYPLKRAREVQRRVFAALEDYELAGIDRAEPLDGTEELLAWLRSRGFECAIVSSNGTRAVESTLVRLGLKAFFVGVFGRDPSRRLKPYPDQNRVCLHSLGWGAGETLLVGDSPDDILSAKPLALFTVGIASAPAKQQTLIDAGADRLIHTLTELPAVLERE